MQQLLVITILMAWFVQAPSLHSLSPKERREAVEAMASLGNREAVPALVEAYTKEPRKDLRLSMVATLGQIRDRSAIPGLSEALLGDFESDVRLQAVDSLLRLYIPFDQNEGFWSFIGRIRNIFSEEDRPVVGVNTYVDQTAKDVLVRSLQSDFDPEVRIASVHALGSLRAIDQIPALIDELEGPRNREATEVRIAIIHAMGAIGSQEAGPSLTRVLKDEDKGVVEAAIQAVGIAGYRAAYPALANLFKTSDDGDIREYSLQSIALMREPDAVNLFEALLDDPDDTYRELSAEGIARLNYDASFLLGRIASEGQENVRLAQAFALVSSGESAFIEQLVMALDSRRERQAEAYLFELGKYDGKLGDIYPHLRNPEAKIRAKLLRVLGKIGAAESRPYIEPLTDDPDMEVMQEAVEALRELAPVGL